MVRFNTLLVSFKVKKMFDVQTINIYRQKITKYLSAIFNFSHIHIFDIKIKICQEERTKKKCIYLVE